MSLRKSFSRGFATLSVLAAGAVLALPASAQTTYEWLGNLAGGNNLEWHTLNGADPRFSDQAWPSVVPGTDIPGSLLGANNATTDIVNLRNNRNPTTAATPAQQTETIYLSQNAGDIASVQVGGLFGTAGQGTVGGAWLVQLQLRSGSNANIGQLILGRVDTINPGPATQRGGQLFVAGQAAAGIDGTATVGSIISGSNATNNELIINNGNNGSGGLTLNGNIDSPGVREIGLDIRSTTQSRLVLGGPLDLNLDDVKIGAQGNANVTGVYNFGATGAGSTMVANNLQVGQTSGTPNAAQIVQTNTATGTLSVSGGSSINVVGVASNNGNIDIGNAARVGATLSSVPTQVAAQTATGTVNVEDGTLAATDVIALGAMTRNSLTTTNTPVATGTLNVNQASSVVNAGRVQLNLAGDQETLSGGLSVGQERRGTGTVNVNGGALNSLGRVYVGGEATAAGVGPAGIDRLTVGNLNVNGGALNVGLSDLTNGGLRNPTGTTQLGSADLVLGRDGTGTMTQTGGTTNIYRGNLVLGTSGSGSVRSATRNFNGDGTNVFITVRGFSLPGSAGTSLAAFDSRNELNQNLFDDLTLASPDWEPDPINVGDYKLTASGQAKLLPNVARGTLNFSGGTINVGSTQGAEFRLAGPGNIAELFHDVDYQNGGGDITMSGTGVMNVERNFNMGANHAGIPNVYVPAINTLTVSDRAVLNIGFGDPGDLAGQNSLVTVVGGNTNVDISDDLLLNAGSTLTFDFNGTNVTDFNFDVADNAALGGSTLVLTGNTLASYFGDILLIDANSRTGAFAGFTEGQSVTGAYNFTYMLGGINGKIGLTAIPEPSSLAALAFGCMGLVARRRRRS